MQGLSDVLANTWIPLIQLWGVLEQSSTIKSHVCESCDGKSVLLIFLRPEPVQKLLVPVL